MPDLLTQYRHACARFKIEPVPNQPYVRIVDPDTGIQVVAGAPADEYVLRQMFKDVWIEAMGKRA